MTPHADTLALIERLSAFTGIRMHIDDASKLRSAVAVRERATHCHDTDAYLAMLQHLPDQAALEQERRALSAALIPLESFFFRDAGQVALLRKRLLPACLRERRASRTLRIWSAGCSTGEEAYSLAIMVAELLPLSAGWSIRIIGSDINVQALQCARAGVYPDWSFRGVPDSLRNIYFFKQREGWEILPALRAIVRFCADDLRAGAAPDLAAGEFDLILCRNVLMYYRDDALPRIVNRLTLALAPAGRLLVAHNELAIGCFPALVRQVFAESAVYRRSDSMPEKVAASPSPAALPGISRSRPAAMPAPRQHPPVTVALATPVPLPEALSYAWQLADQGAMAQANACCEQLLARTPLEPGAYYLLAHLAQESGDLQRARTLLEKVIYLEPHYVIAYLELCALYNLACEHLRASRMRRSAKRLLEGMPADAPLGTRGELKAGELLATLRGEQNAIVMYS